MTVNSEVCLCIAGNVCVAVVGQELDKVESLWSLPCIFIPWRAATAKSLSRCAHTGPWSCGYKKMRQKSFFYSQRNRTYITHPSFIFIGLWDLHVRTWQAASDYFCPSVLAKMFLWCLYQITGTDRHRGSCSLTWDRFGSVGFFMGKERKWVKGLWMKMWAEMWQN